MVIKNNRINIDSNDVWECESTATLYKWLSQIHEGLHEINEKITSAKAMRAGKGVYADRDWFNRTNSVKRLQEILALQIKQRIKELETFDSELINILRTKFSKDEWEKILNEVYEAQS